MVTMQVNRPISLKIPFIFSHLRIHCSWCPFERDVLHINSIVMVEYSVENLFK